MNKELEIKQTSEVAKTSLDFMGLFSEAMKSERAMDIIKELTALKNSEEDRIAKKEFDFHFAEMQKNYTSAIKSKTVLNKTGTAILYKYCPLETILKVYQPIISEYGFSFSWYETTEENKKTVTCVVSGYGHEKKSSVVIPIQEGNSFTNEIQQQGVSTTYGKRYSFINAFGVIIEDEDQDGNLNYEDGVQYGHIINLIRSSKDLTELQENFKTLYKEHKDDKIAKEVIIREKNKRKEELE